ncbi:Centromere/kinetochore protein zw10 [Gonapodya sp. JEL0774]|nr:Centromere/kinetochore protein zw10 [Gonapodya sp. JEL0774]
MNTLGVLFDLLLAFFAFIRDTLLPTSRLASNEDSRQALRVFGELVWPELSRAILSEYLEACIPTHVKGLTQFAEIAKTAEEFEGHLKVDGFLTESEFVLSPFCHKLTENFINRKRQTALAAARTLIINKDLKLVRAGGKKELPPLGPTLLERLSRLPHSSDPKISSVPLPKIPRVEVGEIHPSLREPLFVFPECGVSEQIVQLLHLVESVMEEAALAETEDCAIPLTYIAHDIIDLFRLLSPVAHAAPLETVGFAMQFHNDCMMVAHECLTLGFRYRTRVEGKPRSRVVGTEEQTREWKWDWFTRHVLELRPLGEKYFNAQLDKEHAELTSLLATAEGFDLSEPGRMEIVGRALKQCMYTLKQTARVWRPILPPHMYFSAIGYLVDNVLNTCVSGVLELIDIGEDESLRLHRVLGNVRKDLPGLFEGGSSGAHRASPLQTAGSSLTSMSESPGSATTPPPSLPAPADPADPTNADSDTDATDRLLGHYVPRYRKFCVVQSVMDESFAIIMDRFRRGEMREAGFKITEVVGLVKALFADTELRERNLEEIQRGYGEVEG